MKVKQIIAMIVVVALLMTGSVLVTMAYLTSEKQITNVFTVGNIRMILDETDVDLNGDPILVDGEAVRKQEGNKYHLVPGGDYQKDPRVTIVANSDDCYVRMIVVVDDYEALCAAFPISVEENATKYYGDDGVFLLQALVQGWDENTWKFESFAKKAGTKEVIDANGEKETESVINGVYEFRYHEVAKTEPAQDKILEPLFTKVVMPKDIENDALQNLADINLNVIAHAIQADGFNDANEAWTAFQNELGDSNPDEG